DVAYEHAVNHDAEAIELLRDKVSHADRANEHSPYFVAHLVACGINGETTEAIRSVSYDLKVLPQDSAATQPSGAASSAQVGELIAQLLDERALKRGYQISLPGESMQDRDTALNAGMLLPFRLPPAGPLRPMYLLDVIRLMQMLERAAHAGTQADYQSAL